MGPIGARQRVLTGAVAVLLAVAGVAGAGGTPGQAASADEWAELDGILSKLQGTASAPIKNVTTPKFTPGMLLGNGDIGVVVGGDATNNQKLYLGKGDFWGSAWNNGHNRLDTGILSLGSLTVTLPTASAQTSATYAMTQDIENAEVRGSILTGDGAVTFRSFTADSDNVVVTELSNPAARRYR